jgi:hypothetical protein
MADQPRVLYRCDSCGQTDDHPKMHYAAQTYHHDCIPAFVMDDLTSQTYYNVETGQVVDRVPLPEEELHPGTRRLLETAEKAKSGVRGPKLLTWIQSQTVVHEHESSKTYGRKILDVPDLSDEEN